MKKKMNGATLAAVLGGMSIAGYMYMKKNPETAKNMKNMAKSITKKAYEKLDDLN